MCFSLEWVKNLFIWIVIIGAIILIIQILIPLVLSRVPGFASGALAVVWQIIKIVLWAIVVILIIVFAFDMISCLLGMGGGLHLPGSAR
jgi:hypothetical protein